ncbi:hypothetical protein C8R47DRAFT_1313266 [Mycena vitilis]|nr:hypothetical protein C8R47DRAFT_1313266 [Mycena vitilis]
MRSMRGVHRVRAETRMHPSARASYRHLPRERRQRAHAARSPHTLQSHLHTRRAQLRAPAVACAPHSSGETECGSARTRRLSAWVLDAWGSLFTGGDERSTPMGMLTPASVSRKADTASPSQLAVQTRLHAPPIQRRIAANPAAAMHEEMTFPPQSQRRAVLHGWLSNNAGGLHGWGGCGGRSIVSRESGRGGRRVASASLSERTAGKRNEVHELNGKST